MKSKMIIAVTLPLLWAASVAPVVADTTSAKCELFHHGERDKEHSGPCGFSQRQGYVTIRLNRGKTFELSPADEPRHYRDQKGHKVKLRDADANSSTYKWDNKRLEVHWNQGGSSSKHKDANRHSDGPAMAASPDYMMENCRNSSQIFFQDFEARAKTKYEGQRTDGTHAVNGTIYLETRSEDFQCSFNKKGDTMVDFFAEGRSWPAFVRGEGSPHMR